MEYNKFLFISFNLDETDEKVTANDVEEVELGCEFVEMKYNKKFEVHSDDLSSKETKPYLDAIQKELQKFCDYNSEWDRFILFVPFVGYKVNIIHDDEKILTQKIYLLPDNLDKYSMQTDDLKKLNVKSKKLFEMIFTSKALKGRQLLKLPKKEPFQWFDKLDTAIDYLYQKAAKKHKLDVKNLTNLISPLNI